MWCHCPPPTGCPSSHPKRPQCRTACCHCCKKIRIEKLTQHRNALNECERKFVGASRAVKSITRNLFARPEESMKDAMALVGDLVSSMLTDRDIATHLMNDKVANEEVYFHQLNVAVFAMMLGKQLGLERETLTELGLGALLHDIGKSEYS
ncbi:hypothetical protein CSQ89_18620 [Chitinimonas sp. BJB300]|nr:hypothetical protein CSQ89_18620 [Chitinimonas sp. BJB300]